MPTSDDKATPLSGKMSEQEETYLKDRETDIFRKRISRLAGTEMQPSDEIKETIDSPYQLFAFALNDNVINRHGEEGYIDMISLSLNGPLYRVVYPECKFSWYTDTEISRKSIDNTTTESTGEVKTDIKE